MRCDMHVHSVHSGLCNLPLLSSFCNESYSEPGAVYEKLKCAGMSLVTITDHDSIGAVEELRRHPDFFVSEEVSCTLPSGSAMHVGVYDIDDRQHVELQRRRNDAASLLAYVREQRLLFSANHVFSALTGKRVREDFEFFASDFDTFETLNGSMLSITNQLAAEMAGTLGKAVLAGSDGHTVKTAGSCWTEVKGARSKGEFLAGIRQGRGTVHGSSGSYARLTRDILQIGYSMVRARPVTVPVAMLGGLAPAVTLINYFMEKRFSRKWRKQLAWPAATFSEKAAA